MRRSNVFYLLVLLSTAFVSCTSYSSKSLIAGNDGKLWQKVDSAEMLKGSKTFYYFNRDGKFQIYKRYKGKSAIVKLDMGDVILIEEWKLVNKTAINVAGRQYHIVKLNDTCFTFVSGNIHEKPVTLVYKNDTL